MPRMTPLQLRLRQVLGMIDGIAPILAELQLDHDPVHCQGRKRIEAASLIRLKPTGSPTGPGGGPTRRRVDGGIG
jgi:hypothetical protein